MRQVAALTGMHTDKVEKMMPALPYLVALTATMLLPFPGTAEALGLLSTSLSRNSKAHHSPPDVLQPVAYHLAPLMMTSRLHCSHAFCIPTGPQLWKGSSHKWKAMLGGLLWFWFLVYCFVLFFRMDMAQTLNGA